MRSLDACWRACSYLAAGMIYLRERFSELKIRFVHGVDLPEADSWTWPY